MSITHRGNQAHYLISSVTYPLHCLRMINIQIEIFATTFTRYCSPRPYVFISIMSRAVLSTHVLDTSTGRPAFGVFVELYKQKDNSWALWHNTATSSDGRVLFPFTKESMAAGTYKLKFNIEDYYKQLEKETLYPFVEIVFKTEEDQHYHIPLLLSPYGYSTYRGS